jgi:hypothetical protein
MELADAFRVQADSCAKSGSPMYAELLSRAAADIEAGGIVRELLRGHEERPGPSALGLRLLGSVHRLVLERRAGELATYYPSVGGSWEPEGGWSAFRALLEEQPDAVAEWLDRPPQTNEVGRASALFGGLLQLPWEHPVRLFEMGSSAGLNLRADRFAYVDESGAVHGDRDSPVRLDPAWRGTTPTGRVSIVERVGCDVRPVDPSTTEGRTLLTAYVWPDQRDRLERLRGALRVAAEVPAVVHEQSAESFVDGIDLVEGTTTVLWHSVMWQYVSPEEQSAVTHRIEQLGDGADDRHPFVHLSAEPTRRTPGAPHEFLVRMRSWPTGEERLLGTTQAHGLPTVWE